MLFARIFLFLMAAMSVVFGLIYLFLPYSMTSPMGFGVLTPAALTDVRATYGGFQIGMGLFLFWCLNPLRVHTGLLLTLLTIGFVFGCRVIGVLIDGDLTETLKGVLVFEGVLTLLTLVLFLRRPAVAAAVPV